MRSFFVKNNRYKSEKSPYTRQLKAQGIEVFFEKENLWSLDPKSEFIMTICASIAQEESRSISQNVTMGKRWSMQAGKVSMAFKTFLGYKKNPDGSIGIDEEQAEVVRLIYRLFLIDGKTTSGIAKYGIQPTSTERSFTNATASLIRAKRSAAPRP